MNHRKKHLKWQLAGLILLVLCPSCKPSSTRNRVDENNFPRVILWAWERPEDLQFLDSQRFGVAFLAQTLTLKDDDVLVIPRRQPLKVAPATRLIAVTRIESQKTTHARAVFSDSQRRKLVAHIVRTMELPNAAAIQVDFDAVTSERVFYHKLLEDLRRSLPDNIPLSMTALASFCIGDRWLKDVPVDEAIPMVFRMGTDSKHIKNLLAEGGDFREGLCRRSYGVALDEPVKTKFDGSRRVYVFNSRAWTQTDVATLTERLGQ